MSVHDEDSTVAHPEVVTLHWEGPAAVEPAYEPAFADSQEEDREALAEEMRREVQEIRSSESGQTLWRQIQNEAVSRGDVELWRRKLHAYSWVKMEVLGTAGDYARRFDVNHATVRSWIHDIAKLAYEVGYRLHEDKLLLVGEAPEGLRRLRELVNRDAASPQAWDALMKVETRFRGEDPYFHLNEGHILRAHHRLAESDATLVTGLAIAEAPRLRSLLWNARGQTLWDCEPDSDHPLPDRLERAERCFRRAVTLDRSTYFPFVNLSQMAVDARDTKRAEYWMSELAVARKRMDDDMQAGLARYLEQAEWTGPVEDTRFWRNGPLKWIREATKRGLLTLLTAASLLAFSAPPATAAGEPPLGPDIVANSGAGGN